MRAGLVGFLFFISTITSAERFRPATIPFPDSMPNLPPYIFKEVFNFKDFSFERPIGLVFAPDDSERVFVVEERGTILVFRENAQDQRPKLFLDIRHLVNFDGHERGLWTLAPAPDFKTSQEFFICYAALKNKNGKILNTLVVSRFKVSNNDLLEADLNSLEVILEIEKDFPLQNPKDTWQFNYHFGGMIAFGPDNMLYIGTGDGGGSGGLFRTSQNLNSYWGKILRIDPFSSSSSKPYAIPTDNPFVKHPEALPEVWAYGFRNPWRFSFDSLTNQMWLGDVGQDSYEEINIVKAGGNYGWNVFEGSYRHAAHNDGPIAGINYKNPVWDYGRDLGRSVTGGLVYYGHKIPSLKGYYVYGDLNSNSTWALKLHSELPTENIALGNVQTPTAFSTDNEGELYVVSIYGNKIYKLFSNEQKIPTLPERLSETGIFKNIEALVPEEGIEEYEVISPLWSDGAHKRRWMGLGPSGKIDFKDKDAWNFPPRSFFVKHFAYTTPENKIRNLETRVLFLHTEGWRGYTYRWNPEQTDAFLIDNAETEEILVKDLLRPEGYRKQTWVYPSRSHCLTCHNQAIGEVLGVRTAQINHEDENLNLLKQLNNLDLFYQPIGDFNQYDRMVSPINAASSLEKRVRSYLSANCSHCHSPGTPARGDMDFRYHVDLEKMNILNIPAIGHNFGISNPRRIKAHEPEESILFLRMQTTDKSYRMPALASSVIDLDALELFKQWIGSINTDAD